MKISTIDVNAKEWFDRLNGNAYFSAKISLNYGMPDEVNLVIPFEYGYGDHYLDIANALLQDKGYIPFNRQESGLRYPLWQYCRDNSIILRKNKKENCLKKEVKVWGEK